MKDPLKQHRARFLQAALAGKTHIYPYGLEALVLQQRAYYAANKQRVEPLDPDFEPNPFLYQYDLEVHLFLNYDRIVAEQTTWLETQLIEATGKRLGQLTDKLEYVKEHGTGVPRIEHFWNACSLRWPTRMVDGKERGSFIREPWGDDFIKGLTEYEYVYAFGGSGQGKTHRALAFMCVVWDHYIDHQIGGRCRFSTVSEDKMKESTWPYLKRIYTETQPGISLYAGRGVPSSDYTIARPHDKKGGSSIKGILLPRRNDNVAVDKITGSHGHPVGVYHIDELQATPEAPIQASPNFLQNCTYGWVTASGNFDLPNDSLGKNVKPVGGWGEVDETTHIYECVNMLGIKSLAIHYNNNLSPAFDGAGAKRWGHILPTKAKREARYPTQASRRTEAYRRLWVGWRERTLIAESVLNSLSLKEMGCKSKEPNWDKAWPVTHAWSFDSAPTSTDRNILTHFADGVDATTGKWKIHFYETVAIKKIENPDEYLHLATEEILIHSKKWGVKSGNAIMDWTNITGLLEKFKEKGFLVRPMVYNQSPPDGLKADKRTKEVFRPVILHAESQKQAHQECINYITMGATLMQNFMLFGQLTGLHDEYINNQNSDKSYEEELCLRKFIVTNTRHLGEVLQLEPKHSKHGRTGFTKSHGFSPDILDTMFQAMVFAALYRGMVPGMFNGSKKGYRYDLKTTEAEDFKIEEETNALWTPDDYGKSQPKGMDFDDLFIINTGAW